MAANQTNRPRFTSTERSQVLDDLAQILERTDRVRTTLYVVARREGKIPTAWSDEQLDALMDAAQRLHDAAVRAPQNGD